MHKSSLKAKLSLLAIGVYFPDIHNLESCHTDLLPSLFSFALIQGVLTSEALSSQGCCGADQVVVRASRLGCVRPEQLPAAYVGTEYSA